MNAIIEVVLPIFAIVAAGYGCGRTGVLGEASSQALNGFVYYVAMPAVFFTSTANASFGVVFHGPYIATFMGGLLLSAMIAVIAGRRLFALNGRECMMHGMASIFSNTGYIGIPLLTQVYGAEGVLPAVIGTLCTGAIVMPLSLAALQFASPDGSSALTGLARAFAMVARNPMVLATGLGVLWSLTFGPDSLPSPAIRFLDMLAVTAGPCALFAMGLFLVGRSIANGWQESLWLSLIKLIIQPAITFVLARYLFGLDSFLTACAVILAGLPTGTLVFVVAQRTGVYVQRSTTSIIVSTALSTIGLSIIMILFGPEII